MGEAIRQGLLPPPGLPYQEQHLTAFSWDRGILGLRPAGGHLRRPSSRRRRHGGHQEPL